MRKVGCAFAAWVLIWPGTSALAQTTQQELLQKLATVKESVARNQAALREFVWTERIVTSEKGEVRRTETATCHYLPDDQLQRTPVSASEKPLSTLKAKVFEMKSAALETYRQRLLALLNQYLPPSPRLMSTAHEVGNVSLGPHASGTISLSFKNYLVSGDSLIFNFDSASRSLRKVFVNTYLGDPKDPVTLFAVFGTLPDGTNFVSSTVLNEKAKGIQITMQDGNYQRAEP
jgi:hypothetical protein